MLIVSELVVGLRWELVVGFGWELKVGFGWDQKSYPKEKKVPQVLVMLE